MAIKADFHLHSSFSGDSKTPMEEMILAGIRSGLNCMCFTEHMDMDFIYIKPEEEGQFTLNTDSYLYDLLKYKEKYASQIKLLFGVELGVQPHLRRELAVYAKSFDFDFIIITSEKFFNEIQEDLVNKYGIDEEKILPLSCLYSMIDKYYPHCGE